MAETNGNIYRAELEGIRAPLGVILYFIKRDSLDIYDIPIAKITRDYLSYLDLMEELQIDLAGDFFVMAATLMRIKIQMLLRRDDDEEDPREELVRNLLEYKRLMEAARSLRELEDERSKIFKRPVPQREKEFREEPQLDLNLYEIIKAFRRILAEIEEGDVSRIELDQFTIEEKIDLIVSRVTERGQVLFNELFAGSRSRMELVVTFVALLELMKRGSIRVRQHGAFGEMWIYLGVPFAAGAGEGTDEEPVGRGGPIEPPGVGDDDHG